MYDIILLFLVVVANFETGSNHVTVHVTIPGSFWFQWEEVGSSGPVRDMWWMQE